MSFTLYKTYKPGWFIKRRLLNYVFNDRNGKFLYEKSLALSAPPRSVITKGSYKNEISTRELTSLYKKYLNPIVTHCTRDIYTMNAIWYQQYGKHSGSYHDYHNHYSPECQLSGIYYLRLKDSSLKTQFLNINELDIEEGDMILFDSRAMHRSPPNHTKDDKIILSFNLRLQSNQN